MPDVSKFIDELKTKTLEEYRNQDNLPELVLGESTTNRRLTGDLAIEYFAELQIISRFSEPYKKAFLDYYLEDLVTLFRSVDGWSVDKAIEAEGVMLERQQKQKGIMGSIGSLFGIGGDNK